MRVATKAGFITGGVVGLAVGAGLLMAPQGKQMRKAIVRGADQIKHQFRHGHIG